MDAINAYGGKRALDECRITGKSRAKGITWILLDPVIHQLSNSLIERPALENGFGPAIGWVLSDQSQLLSVRHG